MVASKSNVGDGDVLICLGNRLGGIIESTSVIDEPILTAASAAIMASEPIVGLSLVTSGSFSVSDATT